VESLGFIFHNSNVGSGRTVVLNASDFYKYNVLEIKHSTACLLWYAVTKRETGNKSIDQQNSI
jgi:hypothetical protein